MSRFAHLQEMLSSLLERYSDPEPGKDERTTRELCEALLSGRGELSGNEIAQSVLSRIDTTDVAANIAFFDLLLSDYDIDASAAVAVAQAYAREATADNWQSLINVTESRRQALLRRLNRVPGATEKLVCLRERLLAQLESYPKLRRVDIDFEYLFNAWFNRGFLVMRQIDWHTSANVLEKIIQYEAVHAINDWADLRSRLEPADRRCFAFFHPAMPDDPLIFVEVALTQSLPDSIQAVLEAGRDPLKATEADTAVFYSISNCQAGLKGVSFGNFLIKQVASELAHEFPNLTSFRTLSPIPSLISWAKTLQADSAHYDAAQTAVGLAMQASVADELGLIENSEAVTQQLRSLAAEFLVRVRREDNQPQDPVARFHLGNGASLSEVIGSANISATGLSRSAGIMVSYLYDLDAVGKNHEAYATKRMVTTTRAVENLLAST